MNVYADFETRSACDIWKANASVYSNDVSTSILCGVFKKGTYTLRVTDFAKERGSLLGFIGDNILVAHNAIFEQLIWENILVKKYGYPRMPPNRWKCTRAKGQSHGLPGSLEKLAEALNLLQQKDMGGKKHMLKMCKPDGPTDEVSMGVLLDYCEQDVKTTMAIDEALPDLTPFEQSIWELDQEINMRGVKCDRKLITEIIGLIEYEKGQLSSRFEYLVSGKVGSARSAVALRCFLAEEGFKVDSVNAASVQELLKGECPEHIREILSIRAILAKSSTAKYSKMVSMMDSDDRLRENLVYHGASTGRWTGQGVQLQNLPKPKQPPEYALQTIDIADAAWPLEYNSINQAASNLVRSMLIPETGKSFVGGDFSGIEARILPWIARQTETLKMFSKGEDPYLAAATKTFGRTVTKEDKDERQVGKCQVLGLGFQGGIAALYKMCMIYNLSLAPIATEFLKKATSEELDSAGFIYDGYEKEALKSGADHFNRPEGLCADILKQRWRRANPQIVQFWGNVEQGAICTTRGESYINPYRNLTWINRPSFLYLELPSGRRLAYYKPEVKMITNKFGKTKETLTYSAVDPKTKQLMRESTYGGKLTENIVQAIARDVMAASMDKLKNKGKSIVLTVHDEILLETDRNSDLSEIEQYFINPPVWALDLPLAADLWKGDRYQK